MTHFRKPKRDHAAAPRTCERCGERPGTINLHSLAPARGRGSLEGDPDWWLCAECARLVGRDEPEGA